ncbi:MAG: DUF3857 domain-containing protein, partial [Cytophagaceae bacterium]
MRLIPILLLATIPAIAPASEDIRYGTQLPWTTLPAENTDDEVREGGVHVRYNDTQIEILPAGTSTFSTYRIALVQPEALQLGNLNIAWNPQTTEVIVNRVFVHRGDEVIDVLKNQKFQIFQREGRLEQAMLDGLL